MLYNTLLNYVYLMVQSLKRDRVVNRNGIQICLMVIKILVSPKVKIIKRLKWGRDI